MKESCDNDGRKCVRNVNDSTRHLTSRADAFFARDFQSKKSAGLVVEDTFPLILS